LPTFRKTTLEVFRLFCRGRPGALPRRTGPLRGAETGGAGGAARTHPLAVLPAIRDVEGGLVVVLNQVLATHALCARDSHVREKRRDTGEVSFRRFLSTGAARTKGVRERWQTRPPLTGEASFAP
jgi:hypothetical protein